MALARIRRRREHDAVILNELFILGHSGFAPFCVSVEVMNQPDYVVGATPPAASGHDGQMSYSGRCLRRLYASAAAASGLSPCWTDHIWSSRLAFKPFRSRCIRTTSGFSGRFAVLMYRPEWYSLAPISTLPILAIVDTTSLVIFFPSHSTSISALICPYHHNLTYFSSQTPSSISKIASIHDASSHATSWRIRRFRLSVLLSHCLPTDPRRYPIIIRKL